MQKISISIEKHPQLSGTFIAHFEGDFDGGVKENLKEVEQIVQGATGKTVLIMDFKKLNFLNSYAIGHLVAWHNHLQKTGGHIAIYGASKNVEDIFAILGMDHIFKILPSLEAAMQVA